MKKKIDKNITFVNSISSLLLQLLTIVSGFIIPKLTLNTFGSEVNGLISSITQFLSYINLLEGGITGVITASLYKPIFNHDEEKISSIMKTTQKFYSRISIIFIIYSILLALTYPLVFNNNFNYLYTFSLTLILSITMFIQYMFSISLKTLLTANKRLYVVSFVQIIILIINVVLFYIIIKIYPNIHVLKLITGLVYIVQPIVFNKVVNKCFKINKSAKEDKELLKSRWDGFAINIAYFIHTNTDITILTSLTNLMKVSVYSVYALVTNGLKRLLLSVSNGISPTMGNIYASDKKDELNNKFELYEYVMFILVYFFFTVGGLLITPFVLIYTSNITDISYNEPLMGYILMMAEGMYCLREPYVGLAYSANKFKEIKRPAYIEAILNIVVSIVLVFKFGLIGVAIGTLIAMTYRTIFHVHYFKNNVLFRNPKYFYKKLVLFSLGSIIGVFVCKLFISINPNTIMNWIICAIIYSIIFGLLYLVISLIFYKEDLNYFINKFLKRKSSSLYKHTKSN